MGGEVCARRAAWVALVLLSAAVGGSGAEAADSATNIAAAKSAAMRSLAAGNAAAACATLQPLLPAHQDDLVLHFLVGECLARTGKPHAAIVEYRFILARDSNAIRARASLAAAEAAAGDLVAARGDFEAILAHDLPQPVRSALQAALDRLPQRSHWSAVLTLGGMYDSNPGVGPWKSVVTMFGAPFRLIGAPPRAESDWAALATAALNYGYAIDADWALQASAGANTVAYAKLTHFDFDSYSLTAGPTFHADWMNVTTNAGASVARLGETLYSVSWGASPEIVVPLVSHLIFDEGLSVQRNYYYTSNVADGWSFSAVSALQWHFAGSAAFVQPKLTLVRQATVSSLYTDNQIGGAVDVFEPLGAGFSLLFEPSLTEIYYRANDPAFGTTRHDKTYAVMANLGYQLGYHHSQLALGVTVTGNRSNQNLYSYNRTQATLQFKLPF